MPKNEPNEAARNLMALAAKDGAEISRTLADLLALTTRINEHLLAGRLFEADEERVKLLPRALDLPKYQTRMADRIGAIRQVDEEYFTEQQRRAGVKDREAIISEVTAILSHIPVGRLRQHLETHERACPNDREKCEIGKLIRARIAELESK